MGDSVIFILKTTFHCRSESGNMEFISSFSVGLITKEQINFYLSNGYLVIKEKRARRGGEGGGKAKEDILCCVFG